jgi:hypothetical protein
MLYKKSKINITPDSSQIYSGTMFLKLDNILPFTKRPVRQRSKGYTVGEKNNESGVLYRTTTGGSLWDVVNITYPGLGFEEREDYKSFNSEILYGWFPTGNSFLFRHQVSLFGYMIFRNSDGSTESAELSPKWEFDSKSGYWGSITPSYFYENIADTFDLSSEAEIPTGQYEFYGLRIRFGTPGGNPFSLSNIIIAGSFYDGWRFSFTTEQQWHLSSTVDLSGSYEYNRVTFPDRDQLFISHIGQLRGLLMFSTKLSVITFIQYNSVDNVIVTNVRLRYNPSEGIDFYLVYNEGLNTNRFREFPTFPFSNDRTVLLKFNYTFNL